MRARLLALSAAGLFGLLSSSSTANPMAASTAGTQSATQLKQSQRSSKKASEKKVTARLKKRRKPERYEETRKGSKIRAGGARLHLNADVSTLEKVLLDFRRYTELGEEFDQVKVLRKNKKTGETDVYIRFPILHGASHLWVILRFQPKVCPSKNVCELRAKMVKGNVKRFDVTYRMHELSDDDSRLDVEMHVDPGLPFAASIVSNQVSRQSAKAARRVREKAELIDKRQRAAKGRSKRGSKG